MEWKEVRLGDVCEIYGRIGFRGYTTNDLVDTPKEGAISLSPKNIINGELNLDQCTYIKWDKYYESPEIMINPNEIIITKTGSSVGRTTFVRRVVHPMTLNPQLVLLKNISENAEFLSYYIKSALFQSVLKSIVVGSAIPTLSQKNLANLIINVPKEVAYQHRIASILSSLDRKIELNNKINADLEEMAQAIFKNWFVDFEPFKDGKFVDSELGMIPEGWKVGRLTEIASYMNGLAMQKFPPENNEESLPVLKIKELGQGFCGTDSDRCSCNIKDECKIHNGDVIFSWSGTLLVDVWCGGDCGLNQHLFKVTSKDYPKWFYYYWTKHHLQEFIHIAKDKAVTMGHIKRGHLEEALVAIPDNNSMEKAHELFEPILSKMISLRLENSRLSLLRDTLLPRLMSGELEVPE